MSHEIRTPMNGVIGMTELALDTDLDKTQRLYLDTVRSSAQSLMVILNEILDFSKIESGKLELEHVEFDIRALFGDTLRGLDSVAAKKGIALTLQVPEDLPSMVIGDPVRVRQVLTNICDNAIKFTPDGTVAVSLQVNESGEAQHNILVSVADSGIGIPQNKLDLIFDAFSQVDSSTTRKFGGTGLGLTICARLVELMGGRIWVESRVGMGTTFRFTLQLESVNDVTTAQRDLPKIEIAPQHVVPAEQSRRHQDKLRVLVAEDNAVNQLLITSLLKKWGHEVDVASNGKEAIEMFSSARWDIVLMDIQMPVMGGIEATRVIRARQLAGLLPQVPVIAVTANARAEDRQACIDAGADDFLSKPIDQNALEKILQDYGRRIPALG